MSLNTSKSISKVVYNNVEIPLANSGTSGDGISKLTINVIQQPTDSEWNLSICGKTPDEDAIILNKDNLSAEIEVVKNKLFVLYTTAAIDYVESSDWGAFDSLNVSTDYAQPSNEISNKTYVCYAGDTNTATWNITFR